MIEWVQVKGGRDPFSRITLMRRKLYQCQRCEWCGTHAKGPQARLFQYGYERDGLATRPEPVKGLFCSISCMRSYHG